MIPIALGTQRLVLQPPDVVEAVLERAHALGVAWLDTADIYGTSPGEGEQALAPWADRFRIVTKGGLVPNRRRNPPFVPDGRARHLIAAAEASRDRLGVDRLDAFLLHVPDPRTPFRTSLRALRQLVDRGIAKAVGLSNVGVGQLREALDHVDVRWVQVPFSPTDAMSARSGILEACLRQGVEVLAHRPLGGTAKAARLQAHRKLAPLARDRGVTPAELVLAWIRSLGFTPLPGPSRLETLESAVRAAHLDLDAPARDTLDALFVTGGRLRRPRSARAPSPDHSHEVRLIMGSPGSGKTTRARSFVADGYHRLNRDDRGGTLRGLLRHLTTYLEEGGGSVVLDNTYPSRAVRYDVIETAWAHGVPVRLTRVATPPADCERNAIDRMLDRIGRLPEPDEIDRLNRKEPAVLPPRALLAYRNRYEAPELDEGYAAIDVVSFERHPTPGHVGVLVDPDHLEAFAEPLAQATARGFAVLMAGWQPGADPVARAAELEAAAHARGIVAHAAVCPHPAGPPVCWCRKPWLGLPLRLARAHDIDVDTLIVVATSPSDRTVADKLGRPIVDTPEALSAQLTKLR